MVGSLRCTRNRRHRSNLGSVSLNVSKGSVSDSWKGTRIWSKESFIGSIVNKGSCERSSRYSLVQTSGRSKRSKDLVVILARGWSTRGIVLTYPLTRWWGSGRGDDLTILSLKVAWDGRVNGMTGGQVTGFPTLSYSPWGLSSTEIEGCLLQSVSQDRGILDYFRFSMRRVRGLS